ncbi:MAG: DUF6273 domain-containing protein [Clostridiales bacterium]|nr:DUF6273 domain-containing protein [Clostridiales bacterium]
MKRFRLFRTFVIFSLAALMASCSNMGGDVSAPLLFLTDNPTAVGGGATVNPQDSNPANQRVLVLNASLQGLPSVNAPSQNQVQSSENSFGISQSAFPNIDQIAGSAYSFSATLEASGGRSFTAPGTYDSGTGTCSFAFAGALSDSAVDYTLTVNLLYTASGASEGTAIATGSQSVSIPANANTFDASIALSPITDSGVRGSVALALSFTDTSITRVVVTLLNSSGTDVTSSCMQYKNNAVTSGSVTLQSGINGIAAGSYTLLMSYDKGSQNSYVGCRMESINVYPSLATNLWWVNGTAESTLTISQSNQTQYWVRGTGGDFYTNIMPDAAADDTNTGSFASPLKSLWQAVKRIQSNGDGISEYTIIVDGTLTAASGDTFESYSMAKTNGTQKILIKGFKSRDVDGINANLLARFLYVDGNVVTLKGLKITGGSAGSGEGTHGGAIYVRSGTLIINDCEISGNYAYTNGGAIYNLGSLTINDSAIRSNEAGNCGGGIFLYGDSATVSSLEATRLEISSNEANTRLTTTGNGGGGIFKQTLATLKFKSGSIKGNSALAGGGIYSQGAATKELFEIGQGSAASDVEISGNSATGAGGGIYMGGGNADFKSGTVKANAAAGNGKGAYVNGTFYISGSAHFTSDNDLYLMSSASINVASNLTTASPAVTVTPATYYVGKQILAGSYSANYTKFAVTEVEDENWSIDSEGKLSNNVVSVYISASGYDDTGTGSKTKPYATIATAISKFTDKTPAMGGSADFPEFVNKIYVLSDYTFTAGANDSTANAYFEIVGCKNGTSGNAVTFTFNTPSDSGFYLSNSVEQKVKFTKINVTQNQSVCATNDYAAINVAGGEFYMEDCSMTGLKANSCSAINADGKVALKNVSIKNNVSVPSSGFGPAVYVKSGNLYISGKVEITDNQVEGGSDMNLWIGDYNSGTPIFHPIVIAGAITNSSIGVTLYSESVSNAFTSGYSTYESAAPSTYFSSDGAMTVSLSSGNAVLLPPSSLYIATSENGGSDTTGLGTEAKPFATLGKAFEKIQTWNNSSIDYTINVGAGAFNTELTLDPSGVMGYKPTASSILVKGASYTDSVLTGGLTHRILTTVDNTTPITLQSLMFANARESSSGGALDVGGSGPLTIKNCYFSNNVVSSGNGGAIYIGSGATCLLDGVLFQANKATSTNSDDGYGGAIYNHGTCYIYGATKIGNADATDHAKSSSDCSNYAGNYGGGIYNAGSLYLGYSSYTSESVNTPASLTGGVYYNYATQGGGIYNAKTLKINSGNIKYNGVSTNGGGIASVSSSSAAASVTMTGGFLDYNYAIAGAGAWIKKDTEDSIFVLADGTVSNNSTTAVGGGAGFMNQGGSLEITGGEISSNEAGTQYGGAILNLGSLEMSDGTISGNTAKVFGGGVMVTVTDPYYGSMTMTGGTISGNSVTDDDDSDFAEGGGVFVADSATFTMSGGRIETNEAERGGAVFVSANADGTCGTFTISGSASLPAGDSSGNTGAGKNDVQLYVVTDGSTITSSYVTIGGALSATEPVATITPSYYTIAHKVLGGTAALISANHDKFAVTTDPSGKSWSVDSSGYLDNSAPASGAISIDTPQGALTLTASATEITTSDTATTISVTATNSSGTDVTDALTWALTIYYGSDTTAIATSATNSYNFLSTFPNGTYTMNVSVVYNGTTYSDNFTITKTVDSSAVSAPTGDYTPLPAGTDGSLGTSGTYVTFGLWPQTIKASSVTVDESDTKTAGAFTYYKGSDNCWYAKLAENAYESSYTYSDGTTVGQGGTAYKYFKVEPIKWRVLTDDYSGKKLLLAESVLVNCKYYDTQDEDRDSGIYPNNYKESRVRAYLNGLSYNKSGTTSSEFSGKGFLQTAFTTSQQSAIATTTVDNSAASTTDSGGNITQATSYVCDDTSDKIFLLSEREATTSAYGFDLYDRFVGDSYGTTSSSRIRKTTDFAKASGAHQNTTAGIGGWWWLRSPYYSRSNAARSVSSRGDAYSNNYVYSDSGGVVPALCVD